MQDVREPHKNAAFNLFGAWAATAILKLLEHENSIPAPSQAPKRVSIQLKVLSAHDRTQASSVPYTVSVLR